MRRFDEISDVNFGNVDAQSYAPSGPVYQDFSDRQFEFFSDPYISSSGNPVIGTGLQLGPGQSYSPVSRVGPTVSVMPRAALDPNLRAGSLFAGGFPTQSNYRGGRGAYQRAFTVDLQERLRRRRRAGHYDR